MDQWFKNYKLALNEHTRKHPWLVPFASAVTIIAAALIIMAPTASQADKTEVQPFVAPAYNDAKNTYVYMASTTTSTTSTTSTSTTTTTTTIVPDWDVNNYRCAEWYDTAITAGWTQDYWPMLSRVIYKESRCNHDSFNPNDPAGGSYGLTQINGYWCTPNKYNPTGYLQARGIINTCQDLFDPLTNLLAAREIFSRHHSWSPWGL